ncbi:MAG: argininosuccinate lyase [Deltaproteobacteria bacterium]|nr:argininosuccinate lyase [Deltaproteobacteria bacterium]
MPGKSIKPPEKSLLSPPEPSAGHKEEEKKTNLLRGRFKLARLPEVEAFSASLPFDRRLYRHDIRGSAAHARMLARVGLLTSREANAIVAGLKEIEHEIENGRFQFDLADEDIHLAVERRLTEKIGAAGRKLHTARSRNDQVALDLRLYLRDEISSIIQLLRALVRSLAAVAARHLETVMPGYTHLQRAQPISLAHHVMAHIEMLERDQERFEQALARTDVMPLGAGALATTTLPIDRKAVARELGFKQVAANSIDAVSDRDFALDFLATAAILTIHLSRMAEEIILWTTAEFGFAELPDEFSTGSSMMPQKKNPDLLELIRSKSGRVTGNLVALLTILKALPLGYNSDLQEDKERVFDTLDTVKPMLGLMAQLWPRITFNTAAMRTAAGGFALATDLAEYLVQRGMPFREAHEKIGALVRELSAADRTLSEVTLAELQNLSPVFQADALKTLRPEHSLRARKVVGGPAPNTVRRRLAELERKLRMN